jgi:hypothetical protein
MCDDIKRHLVSLNETDIEALMKQVNEIDIEELMKNYLETDISQLLEYFCNKEENPKTPKSGRKSGTSSI